MRCHYMSDLHLESQDFTFALPRGEVLIVAGDLCHASCLLPQRKDLYAARQRERVNRFAEIAKANFKHVLLIAGNHDHYDGVFEDTVAALRQGLPGITVLDDEAIEIGGVSFFGTTLWSDLSSLDPVDVESIRRGLGEYFFVKTRRRLDDGSERLEKFRPASSHAAFERACAALKKHLAMPGVGKTVVISHHAPSRKGGNPAFAGNGFDAAFFSDLDGMIAELSNVPIWVHGHTHVQCRYRIGATDVLANCRGFEREPASRTFSAKAHFDL